MPKECIFDFDLTDAHAFSSFLKLLKNEPVSCPMVLRKNEILIQYGTGVPMELRINTLQLLRYYVNENFLDEDKQYVVFFNPSLVRDHINGGNKQSSVRMWQIAGKNKINIIRYNSNSSSQGSINLEKGEYIPFDCSRFSQPPEDTNCRILLKDFSSQMKDLTKIRISKAALVVTERSAHITAMGNSGASEKNINWPDDEIFEGNEDTFEFYEKQEIGKTVVGIFQNVGSLAPNAILRVYSEEGSRVIRFIIPVGCFGELCVYIHPDPQTDK